MKDLKEFQQKQIEFVFTDIDDTLTEDGRLLPEAFAALWKLHDQGLKVIPVTGRPAGWCELIARQWPVDAVIGENGAFYFKLHNNDMKRVFAYDETTREENKNKLKAIEVDVMANVSRVQIASDQFCRLFDLAIDFAEDVKPAIPKEDIQKVVDIFKKHGAQAKVSSIHVNGWFGDYDKLSCCERFLKNEYFLSLEDCADKAVFVGDSPNDAPMFAAFKHSVGVANVKDFEDQMEHLPTYICEHKGGLGFAEFANLLLK